MMMKYGVLYEITTIVATTRKAVSNHISTVIGSSLSIVSISAENLFTILPMGVVSKNDMGDLITLCNI